MSHEDKLLHFSKRLPSEQPTPAIPGDAEFDQYAENYSSALALGILVTGEELNYFARSRVQWLDAQLRKLGVRPAVMVDYGCGTALAAPFFLDILGVQSFIGLDVSLKSLDTARETDGSERATFMLVDDYKPTGQADLVFCNGVFHHIPRAERPAAVNYVYRMLKPGGIFAFWENNPWNMGTFVVKHLTPLDRDARLLPPPAARRLLYTGGFAIVQTDYLFFFFRFMRRLRRFEPHLVRCPVGAQYLVLARKPL